MSGFKSITLNNFRISKVTQRNMQGQTAMDPALQKLSILVITGWPTAKAGVDPLPRLYHTFKDEFSVADGIVHKGQEAVILSSMRLAILEKIHTFWIMLLFSKSQGFPSMASHGLRYQVCSV